MALCLLRFSLSKGVNLNIFQPEAMIIYLYIAGELCRLNRRSDFKFSAPLNPIGYWRSLVSVRSINNIRCEISAKPNCVPSFQLTALLFFILSYKHTHMHTGWKKQPHMFFPPIQKICSQYIGASYLPPANFSLQFSLYVLCICRVLNWHFFHPPFSIFF